MTETHFADSMTLAEGSDPLAGLAPLDQAEGGGDTWITVGELETEDERTVTVVFRRDPLDECNPLDDLETGEYLVRPLAPRFSGPR